MEVEISVRRSDGWETVEFVDVEGIHLVGGKHGESFCYTLLGIREDRLNKVLTDVFDVAESDEELLEDAVPRTDDGTSVAIDRLVE